MTYRFELRTTSARVNLEFELDRDEIPIEDVENLLARTQKIAARACRRKRMWMVEEVTKIESIPD
jgi:hypothetical protein